MGNQTRKKMEGDYGEQAVDSVREIPAIKRREKIDIEIKEVIRAYPEDMANIIKSFSDWSQQFDLWKNIKNDMAAEKARGVLIRLLNASIEMCDGQDIATNKL